MNPTLTEQLEEKINNKTKPLGALGMLEKIALQAGMIQKTIYPKLQNPHLLVFAADHGIAAAGLVNPYPQSVTAEMVLNFIHGGAAINVFCRQNKIGLKVIDAGVNYDFALADHPDFINAKIKKGTANYLFEDAMDLESARTAILKGEVIIKEVAKKGC